MKSKTLIKLTIIAALLIGFWQYQTWSQQRNARQDTSWVTFTTEVEPDRVNKIVITKNEKSLELTRTDSDWMIGENKVDPTKLEPLLAILNQPSVEIVSQNQDRYADLGISNELSNTISYWQGDNKKLILLISSTNTKLIRQKDKQSVYRLSANLNLNTDPETWKAAEEKPTESTSDDEINKK